MAVGRGAQRTGGKCKCTCWCWFNGQRPAASSISSSVAKSTVNMPTAARRLALAFEEGDLLDLDSVCTRPSKWRNRPSFLKVREAV